MKHEHLIRFLFIIVFMLLAALILNPYIPPLDSLMAITFIIWACDEFRKL